MKKAVITIFICLIFLFFPRLSFAKSNFSEDYNVTYTVNAAAMTHVNFNVELTNLTPNFYVRSYNLNLAFKDLQNVKAVDSGGDIPVTIITDTNGSSIQFSFNNRVTGMNKSLIFNLSFDTKDIAQNLNHIWDINIPGIADAPGYSSFNVTVNYPDFLGSPRYVKPAISGTSTASGTLKFTKQDLEKSGISISFGKYQIYNFNLKYHLQNNDLFPVVTEIALPPDTGYQTIQINNISPRPVNVYKDPDGNWMAQFKLSALQKTDIDVSGKAKVSLTPTPEGISQGLKSTYLSSQKYWEADDPKIFRLAQELKTAQNIYRYVVNHLNYDYSRVINDSQRLGAVKILKSPDSAVCLEFTDLFIAIARAAGIPAREVDGYAYTQNQTQRPVSLVKDVLHAWPEYYDFNKQSWIMIDPTWGNTTGGVDYFNTLDFDHIAFVIRGQNSSYPIPAGGYKLVNENDSKDVNVTIGNSFVENNRFDISLNVPDQLVAGIPLQSQIVIRNLGNQAVDNENIDVSTSLLTPKSQRIISDTVLPYGTGTVNVWYNAPNFLTNTTDTIKITLGNDNFSKKIEILPFYKDKIVLWGGFVFVICGIIISVIAFKFGRLPIFKQKG